MIVFPNCKINLGLHILQKRKDGFHDLETIFYPLNFREGLEIIQDPTSAPNLPLLTTSGGLTGLPPSDNICFKAWRLLKNDFPALPVVKMHLHKRIPSGAGLGGGSADGAFTLLLLNKKFNLGLQEDALLDYALQLGSDCPFFIRNKPCIARGRGEIMEEISLDLSPYKIVLVNPGIHINTGWAFSNIRPVADRISLKERIMAPISTWKDTLDNDFELPVSEAFPAIPNIKQELYRMGALYASMSGSGSSVFGLFERTREISFQFPPDYFIREI